MASDAADLYEQVATINTSYLEGHHPFPERMHLSALFATFQLELFDLIVEWVEFAKAEIRHGPRRERGPPMTDGTETILESIKQRRSILERRHPEIDDDLASSKSSIGWPAAPISTLVARAHDHIPSHSGHSPRRFYVVKWRARGWGVSRRRRTAACDVGA